MPDETPESFEFDTIEMRRIPVKIGEVDYILQEADAEAGAVYEDAMIASVTMVDGKPVSISNIKQRELALLSKCLFIREEDEKGKRLRKVVSSFAYGLPMSISNPLIEAVKNISGMLETGEEVGNDSDDTENNSE